MRNLYISNAFSLNMISPEVTIIKPRFERLDSNTDAKLFLIDMIDSGVKPQSIVGHADTAAVFSTELGYPVEPNRVSYTAKRGDCLLVGQYTGPRLQEGIKELPEGAKIEWWIVSGF